ncbi:MAG: tetratricopeptide repeat protein [Planctomycetota bacterium]|jgi:tetratricopeptide (TPR) repeat protein
MGKIVLPWAGLALVLVCTAAAFLPCLWGDFVYDDWRFIANNPFMKSPLDPVAVFSDPDTMDCLPVHDIYRPLRTLLFRIEYGLGHGGAFLHHLMSLLLHGMNTILVFLWIRRLLDNDASQGTASRAALFGATLFSLHPVQVESVAWISSRGDLLFVFFLLLALLNSTDKREGRPAPLCLLLTVIWTLLACFSKESGVLTGGLILLGGLCFPSLRNRTTLLHGVMSLAASVVYLWLRGMVLGPLVAQVAPYGGHAGSNVLFALHGMACQVLLLFKGWWLCVDYPDLHAAPLSTGIWISGLVFAACSLLCLGLLFQLRRGHALFGVLFFLIALLPTSSLVFPMKSLYNDRYLYLPMAGAAMAFAAAMNRLLSHPQRPRVPVPALSSLLLAALASFSLVRCLEWQDGKALWSATLARNPDSIKARVGLSRACFNEGRTDDALFLAREAVRRARTGSSVRVDGLHLTASALARMGRDDEAAEALRQALREVAEAGSGADFSHRIIIVCQNLWAFEMKAGRYPGAVEAADKLLQYEGMTAMGLLLRSQALKAMNRIEEAEAELKKGASLGQDCPELHFELSELYRLTQRPEEARLEFQKGLEIQERISRAE